MKRHVLITLLCASAVWVCATPRIQRVEPLCWWTDMQCPLTLMFQGEDLCDAQVTIQEVVGKRLQKGACTGLTVREQHNAESQNYLFVGIDVRKAGTYRFTLAKGRKKATFDYTVYPRNEQSRFRQSFNTSDVVYLIMSDRFVDGDESNNSTANTAEKADKSNVHGRFGGDIQGIINSLDYIAGTGATAIWPTPLLLDNESAWSYHGYACADYYHIDPRFGSNELYCQMVEAAHQKGIKVLMDMVPNHCGAAHWWMQDLPYRDWVNQFDTFTVTNNVFSANYDINASDFDRQLNNRGWFDHPMPDMNLDNPDLLQYFKQWAIWWIEYAGLDGLRVDTYPYIGAKAADWCKAITDEYPNLNIVGECWTRPASNVAYWQSGTKDFDGYDSHLPTVMDFPVEEAIRQALENDGSGWGAGMARVYDAMAMDYQYADVNRLLIFVGNHDMDRFADIVKDNDLRRVRIGFTLIATLRGIPQLFAGDEYGARSSDRALGHSTLRCPLLPKEQLTPEQRDLYDFHQRLFAFHKTEPVLHHGRTMHFLARDNTYAYFRYTDEGAVFVFINASEEERTIPTAHYIEILSRYQSVGTDILSNTSIDLSRTDIRVPALSEMVVKLTK